MEETKGISYKSKFLLEFYDKYNTYRGMENDEVMNSSILLPNGFVRHKNLYKLIQNPTAVKVLNTSKSVKENNFGDIIHLPNTQGVQEPSEKEKQIIDAYFIHKIKPREISSKFRVSRSKVYKVVEDIKRLMIRVGMHQLNPSRQPGLKDKEICNMIKDY